MAAIIQYSLVIASVCAAPLNLHQLFVSFFPAERQCLTHFPFRIGCVMAAGAALQKNKTKNCVLVQLFWAAHLVSRSAPHWVHSLTVNDWNDCNYYITLAQNLFSLILFIGKINSSLIVVAILLGKLFSQFYCFAFLFFCAFKSAEVTLFSDSSLWVTKMYQVLRVIWVTVLNDLFGACT